jgi:uncharacterized protein DUF4259
MGAWGTGPFDNDDAADWCGTFNEIHPDDRAEFLRETLTEVATWDGVLELPDGAAAVAAAAIIVSLMPSGEPITSAYAPDFLREGGTVELTPADRRLAVRALDRVVGDKSEWREEWAEGGGPDDANPAFVLVAQLHAALQR